MAKKARILYFIFLFQVMAVGPVLPQQIFFNKVPPPEGNAFIHITGMVQDKTGYMWFASKNGLFRYDGFNMESYKHNPGDTNSLATLNLESICIDSAGIIWMGTLGAGLERFDPARGIFTHFRHDPNNASSISSDTVFSVLADHTGTIWLGTNNGLDRRDRKAGGFFHYRHQAEDPESISSNDVRTIYEDREKTLWIGTGSVYGPKDNTGGLNRLDNISGEFTCYLHDPADPHSLANNKVSAILEDSKGNFWVGTAGDGLHTMDRKSGTFQRHPYDPEHPENLSRPKISEMFASTDHITFITEDAAGTIWIGTAESGINHFNPETRTVKHFESEKNLPGAYTDRTAWQAYSSKEGVLWISTLIGGLYTLNPFRKNIPFHNIPGAAVNVLYEEPDGTLWIGTQNIGLFRYNPTAGTIKHFAHDPGNPASLSYNWVSAIIGDSKGRVWVSTHYGLNLWNRQKESFIHYYHDPKNDNSIADNFAMDLCKDKNGSLWVSTLRGLTSMNEKGLFRHYVFYPGDTAKDGMNFINLVFADRFGQIWANNSQNRVTYRLNPRTGRFKTFLKGTGASKTVENKDGTIWVSGDNGLFRYDPGSDDFVRFAYPVTSAEIGRVISMVADNQGNLWILKQDGITRINPARKEASKYSRDYGVQINGEVWWEPSYVGQSGKLYFGLNSGYYTVSPAELSKGLKPPQIVISALLFGNRLSQSNEQVTTPVSTVKEIRLSHTQNIFSFYFTAIDFINPEDNHQYYMLEHYDAGWNRAGPDRRAFYYKVPPGKYIFHVKAANSNGLWAEKTVAVIIAPPWWANGWIRIMAAIAILALVYGIVRWRVHQKFRLQLERSQKENQLADLRNKAAALEMQVLRSQMNPHFIFNSLTSINRFILQNNRVQASEYLAKFSKLMRLILQNSQASFISLESELKSLELYLDLEALRFDHHFMYNITVQKDLDMDTLKVPPLIIQPYAENAIWHGLMQKEEKGCLDIKVSRENNYLCLTITDDGIGREQAAIFAGKSATRHKSMGLKITASRLAMLQPPNSKEPPVTINDLVNTDGTAAGTEVIIKIPV